MTRQNTMYLYVTGLYALMGGLGWYMHQHQMFDVSSWGLILAFLILTLITDALPVKLPGQSGSVSVGFAVIYAGVLLFGPGAGLILGAFAIGLDELEGIPAVAFLSNRAILGLSAGASGLVFTLLGGEPGRVSSLAAILPMVVGGGVYFLVNSTLATLGISIRQKRSVWQIWILNLRWVTPHYLALMPLAFLIAVSFKNLGIIGLIAFFLPLLIARYSFQRYMDMREVFLDTITSLAKALEAKDPYTKGHADRVSAIAVQIARRIGWSEDEIELIKYVGLLHDIGKIGIEDRILKKPGRFTEDEYIQMKKHAEMGAEIIKDIKLLGKGSEWVRHHHEWFNGRGYPHGLQEQNIPQGARILAVADAFDAMTSHRPYKSVRTFDEARAEIRAFAGTQFDPEVVEAFLSIEQLPAPLHEQAEAAAAAEEAD